MKKIIISFFLYLLNIVYFSDFSFAADDSKTGSAQNNANTIIWFVTTDLLINIFFATIVIIATFFLAKVVTHKLTKHLEESYAWEKSGREELVWVLSRTVNITILSIWFSITLTILGFDMGIFLWWLWFGLGFTLKIFLTNFVAWILMVTQWFYHIWDIVEVWNRTWYIRKIHALFTAIEQFDGITYYVPNVTFLEQEVCNYNTNDKRRVDVSVWVDYKTDIFKAKTVLLKVADSFPNVLKTPYADVLVEEIWDSSIKLTLRIWINSTDTFFTLKSNVTETINLAFKQAWITIPFPQITLSNREDFNVKVQK